MNKIDTLIRQRAVDRRKVAEACVSDILQGAKDLGVEITIVGSLAKHRFRVHSDIDLLVHGSIEPDRRAMIERLVADHLRGSNIPYDLIFASDILPERVQAMLDDRV